MPVETISWKKGRVRIIDQTLLPQKLKYLDLADLRSLWQAIRELKVRGAPALGIAAAFGAYLGIRDFRKNDFNGFYKRLKKVSDYLGSSRPTAVNLFNALSEIDSLVLANSDKPVSEIKKIILSNALEMIKQDKRVCRAIGQNGAKLLKDNATVLTHCNAGGLATAGYGTALAIVYVAQEQGKRIKVLATETRPLLQGARLTTWELLYNKIPVTLICDTMVGDVMARGWIDVVIVGADRIAANGDTANKIGTYQLAVLARHHKIPFYIAAPFTSFDLTLKSGKEIPIEQRSAEEVRSIYGCPTAPAKVKVYNPAFDVTPASLINAIVTEKGVIKPPFKTNLKKTFSKAID